MVAQSIYHQEYSLQFVTVLNSAVIIIMEAPVSN